MHSTPVVCIPLSVKGFDLMIYSSGSLHFILLRLSTNAFFSFVLLLLIVPPYGSDFLAYFSNQIKIIAVLCKCSR